MMTATGMETFAGSMEGLEGLVPFDEIILKVDSRCNFACNYCYMYELADQSWRDQPRVMDWYTLMLTAEQINRHSAGHNLEQVHVIFHGGEPLLARRQDPAYFRTAVRILNGVVDPEAGTILQYSMQTNGALLTSEILDEMLELDIHIGVSIDGGRTAQDRSRLYHNGRSTFDDVVRGIRLLNDPKYDAIRGGLLVVADLANDPIELYEELQEFKPTEIDFLLPLGNWTTRPSGYERDEDMQTAKYAQWLWPIFERWYDNPQPNVRLFAEIVRRLMGKPGKVEYLGLNPPGNVVINTDGSIERVDSLRSTYEGAVSTGEAVDTVLLNDILRSDPIIRHRSLGKAALSPICQSCNLVEVCGGAHMPFRYKKDSGGNDFINPAVYCHDLKALIGGMATRMQGFLDTVS